MLAVGSNTSVFESTDGGKTWPNVSAALAESGVSALTYNPDNSDEVVAGFADGEVFITTTGVAGTWTKISRLAANPNAAAPPWGNNPVSSVVIGKNPDPQGPALVYITIGAFDVPHVWVTPINNPMGWQSIGDIGAVNQLPNLPVHTLAIDPNSGGKTIYVGTDAGVYRGATTDGKTYTWSAFNDGFPNVRVKDLQIQPYATKTIMAAATYGRGIWTIDLPAPKILKVTPEGFGAVEGQNTGTITVATFTDSGENPAQPAKDYTATVNFGDGTSVTGTIADNGNGNFSVQVLDGHTYKEESTSGYQVTIRIVDTADGTSASATESINVSDPAVVASGGFSIAATAGVAFSNQRVATFTDPGGPEAVSSNYTATISWQDGTQSAGNISFDPISQTFTVSGDHTYNSAGTYNITVSIFHSSTTVADATVTSTASVAQISTTTTLTVQAVSLVDPQGDGSATFTATVTPSASGPNPPTGTVQFFVDGVLRETDPLPPSGMVTSNTYILPPGNHSGTAVYSGDTTYAGSSGSASFTLIGPVTSGAALFSGSTLSSAPSTQRHVTTPDNIDLAWLLQGSSKKNHHATNEVIWDW